MTLSELVSAVVLKATGKTSTLAAGDAKWEKIRQIANQYISQWQNTTGVDWASLYERARVIGTVSATDAFDLDDDIRQLSHQRGDVVQLVQSDGQVFDYDIVHADKLKTYDESARVCAKIGRQLVFRVPFTASSAAFGASIQVPIYTFADSLTTANDEVPVDIPQWLVLMTAAEYVRNDITKQNQYPNLVAEANALLDRMVDDNDGQVNDVPIQWSPRGRSW